MPGALGLDDGFAAARSRNAARGHGSGSECHARVSPGARRPGESLCIHPERLRDTSRGVVRRLQILEIEIEIEIQLEMEIQLEVKIQRAPELRPLRSENNASD